MSYLEFEQAFRDFPVFSVKDMRKRFPHYDSRRLVEWQNKGYLINIRRGFYCFAQKEKGEHFLRFAANKIYSPSYVSLESALSFYNLIPESVFTTTSVTTKNTARYNTTVGQFSFNHVKPNLFFGYRLINTANFTIKIAEPEKAILDFFYLNKIENSNDLEALRFNVDSALEILDFNRLKKYQTQFSFKILDKKIELFNKYIHA